MAQVNNYNKFNEATRVQMPALIHLDRLGYNYFGKISEDMSETIFDADTNILIQVFKEKFCEFNPGHEGEFEQTFKTIRQELDCDDLGRSFYKSRCRRLTTLQLWKLLCHVVMKFILPLN